MKQIPEIEKVNYIDMIKGKENKYDTCGHVTSP